ncbi:MAG: hypothetical protein ACQR33_01445 [Candidatus Saccharibacteria bacterium]
MCVTAGPARITNTRTYVYVPPQGNDGIRHICGYQNEAETDFGNCMFLNFAGTNLQLVRGPELTTSFMRDMTSTLENLQWAIRGRGLSFGGTRSAAVTIENYGDYTTLRAQNPADILDALDDPQIPANRRPKRRSAIEAMAKFYQDFRPNDSFVLACFAGRVKPKHPITVSYTPHNPNVLTVPGIDGHDGFVPKLGELVHRDFSVAFGVHGLDLRTPVSYQDRVSDAWAPQSVSGFVDNREVAANGDYVVPMDAIADGYSGRALAYFLENK